MNSKNKNKSALAQDQRDLAVKLKESFSELENELAQISGLIQQAEDGDLQMAEKIKSKQSNLRNLMGRIRAGFMRTTDLDRESSEWKSLLNSGDIDPIQLEKFKILISELELRDTKGTKSLIKRKFLDDAVAPESLATVVVPEPVQVPLVPESSEPDGRLDCVVVQLDQTTHDDESANHLEMVPETLLAGIQHTSRELAKYNEYKNFDHDFLHTIHELRALHAALKVLDKKNGYCRDRIAATQGFERIFSSID